ncbi:hypothetical protein J2I47_00860 [Fibrella sp. HMF5335]|uniref:Virulence-associated protein E-like domain-containing protein n=1 Tax=Fibrella rubiginis TaxID=2817060 RepID=A0A939GD79_9BACT|nr:VapE domain-containing protein [Fibrella rubiginis]MBO0935084.1 hypothetical protein [Fibrella rubiginis]
MKPILEPLKPKLDKLRAEAAAAIGVNADSSQPQPPSTKPRRISHHNETEGKKSKRQMVERNLESLYQFRYNELTGGVEFTPYGKDTFRSLDDYQLNSICRQLDTKRQIEIAPATLLGYLQSDFVPSYHPLIDYFKGLSDREGTATIDAVAATVQVENAGLFAEALMRWMVAAVANAVEKNKRICRNQTCLVLTGGQGIFKTTWLDGLCPPTLLPYKFTGKINLENKDTLVLLALKFIINLDDQLRELNKKDADTVKTLISHGSVTVRRPYDKITSELERTASFLASVNHDEFLADSTGSRRFFPFRVLDIDLDTFQKLDIDHAWAEANTLYKSGFKYWWSADEVAAKFNNSDEFQVVTPESEMLHHYYEVVNDVSQSSVALTTTMLLSRLQDKTRVTLSLKKLGEALRKANAIRQKAKGKNRNYCYFLRERTGSELEALSTPDLASSQESG